MKKKKKKKKTEEKEKARSHLLPFRYLELNSPSFTIALTEKKKHTTMKEHLLSYESPLH